MEIHALARRGWTKSAIARHTGRDRKSVAKYRAGGRPGRERQPSCLVPFRGYLEARCSDDAHVLATVLYEELVGLGFDRSCPTLVRELRTLQLRPMCECCRAGGVNVTVGLEHEPGEELQLDWLELPGTPWGERAYLLVGVLSHSGRVRGVFSDGQAFAQLIEALDGLLRRFGGTTRSWRTDRMATVVGIALGLKAVHAGYRVHYTTAADLVARTSRAASQGRWENTMRFWAGPQVLIVDELGYLPMVGEAASHLFQVISRRYLHGSVILTTNRGIAESGAILEDSTVAVAFLDRLLQYATVLQINGHSYRMRGHRARLQQLRSVPADPPVSR